MSGARKFLPLALIAPVALVLDQWSKYAAVVHLTRAIGGGGLNNFYAAKHLLAQRTGAYTVNAFWDFRYAENPGAAWSFLAAANESIRVPFFFGVAIAATILIGYFYVKSEPAQALRRVALAMVMGGALGNTLDRICHGYVIDFILWHVGAHEWPVFNVADSFVCVGVALLLTENWFVKKPATSAAPAGS